jgi:hypothetical protein
MYNDTVNKILDDWFDRYDETEGLSAIKNAKSLVNAKNTIQDDIITKSIVDNSEKSKHLKVIE